MKEKAKRTMNSLSDNSECMSDLKQIESQHIEYVNAFESLIEMIVILDKDYICRAVNRSFLNGYSLNKPMVVGQRIGPIIGQEFFRTILKPKIDCCFKGETVFYEMTVENKEGEKRYLQFRCSPIITNNSINRSMVTISDETEKQKLSREKTNLIKELQANIKKIKQINGTLPICMSCRKVQDHKGYWNQIESYFQDLLQVNLSQCICPECKEKLYTDIKI